VVDVNDEEHREERPMTVHTTVASPLGDLHLVGEESPTANGGVALVSVSVPGQRDGGPQGRSDAAAFAEVKRQLGEYFAGERHHFDLERATHGPPFHERVWKALDAIPYGTTTTYGRLAEQIGARRSAVRAVGAAVGANPLLVVRPCHRVIGADGSLTGYAGGLERKRLLLTLEGVLQQQLAGTE
jgi:methylated-DNA-[protein]-cysteine S-methyltransferase